MDYSTTAGQELRRLRQKYGLTLQDAADRMLISASVLSRRERGVEPSRREDIQSAITAYRLTEEEACSLWMAARI
jgi:transcriptional regulator with XRE-family HTH domain